MSDEKKNETLGQRVAREWSAGKSAPDWALANLAALVDRLSPPPSRAGGEGVEALLHEIRDPDISYRFAASILTRALESERERAARRCEAVASAAERKADGIADALGVSDPAHDYATGEKVGARACAAAIRDGAKGA